VCLPGTLRRPREKWTLGETNQNKELQLLLSRNVVLIYEDQRPEEVQLCKKIGKK
jgi:hypothetical protein